MVLLIILCNWTRESLYVVVANVLDCNIIVSEFKLQSCYYVLFWINTLGKGMNCFIFSTRS